MTTRLLRAPSDACEPAASTTRSGPLNAGEAAGLWIAAAGVVGFGFYGVAIHSPNTGLYVLVVLAMGAALLRLRGPGLPPALAVGLSVLALGHLAGGLVRIHHDVLYNATLGGQLWRYDHLVHSAGVFVGTLTMWQLFMGEATVISRRAAVGMCALAGIGLGGVNEVIEFLSTQLHHGSHVGGYVNTGWDLVCNAVGAAAAATWLARRS